MRQRFVLALLAAGVATGAPADKIGADTVGADSITAGEWQVLAVDGRPFAAAARLALDPAGGISGKAPCNRYFGRNGAVLPALALGGMATTRMACDAMAAEDLYLGALSAMTSAALREGHLILTGPGTGSGGRSIELVRNAADPALTCLTCPG